MMKTLFMNGIVESLKLLLPIPLPYIEVNSLKNHKSIEANPQLTSVNVQSRRLYFASCQKILLGFVHANFQRCSVFFYFETENDIPPLWQGMG